MGSFLCKDAVVQGDPGGKNAKLPSVTINNTTQKVIILRDREGKVYGALRHKVYPNEEKKVSVNLKEAGTYYRMAVLVVAGNGEDINKVEPTMPPLFIDTDDLHSHSTITISNQDGKYVLHKEPRKKIPRSAYR